MNCHGLASKVVAAAVAICVGGCALMVESRAGAQQDMPSEAISTVTPPIGQFIEIEGQRVHAVVRGSGPDIVLIHGASGNLRDFTFDLIPRLEDSFRVIAFDRPGLGWSDRLADAGGISPIAQADVLRAAAVQLGVHNPIVLGHSYGGAVALGWALRDPENTAALVLLAPASHPWPGNLGLWYRLTSNWLGRQVLIPAIAGLAPRTRAEAVTRRIFEPDPVPDGYLDYIGLDLALRRSQLEVNAVQVNALRRHVEAMYPAYPGLALPVEILHGTADTTVGLHIHSERLAADIPGATLHLLEGVGHMPHHARPADIVDAIGRAASRAGLR